MLEKMQTRSRKHDPPSMQQVRRWNSMEVEFSFALFLLSSSNNTPTNESKELISQISPG